MTREERLAKILKENKYRFDVDDDGRLIPKPPKPPERRVECHKFDIPSPVGFLCVIVVIVIIAWAMTY